MKRLLSLPPVSFALDLAESASEAGTPRTAAALSYFLLLTLFPLLGCVNWFIGFFSTDLMAHLEPLEQILPSGVMDIVENYLVYAARTQSPALLVACLFTILMSASAGLRSVFLTLEDLARVPHRGTLWMAVHSVVLSLLLLLTVYLSMVVVFTGDWFFNVLGDWLPEALLRLIPLESLSAIWKYLRYLVLFCVVLVLILSVYLAGIPRRAVKWKVQLVSALLSAGTLVGASVIFSWFVGFSTRYALVYGSLASLIVLMMWLYFCGNIILLGAAAGCVWTRRHPEPQGEG